MASSREQVRQQQASSSSTSTSTSTSSSSSERRLDLRKDLHLETHDLQQSCPENDVKRPVYTLLNEMAQISESSFTNGNRARQQLRQHQLTMIKTLFDYREQIVVAPRVDERHYLAIDFDDTMSRSFYPNGSIQSSSRASFIRPMEALFAQMRESGETQVEIFSHKTTFEGMRPDRQKAQEESYLQFLLRHPEFDVYTSDDLLYADVPPGFTGFSSRDIALPLMRRFYDDEGRFRPNISIDDMQSITLSLENLNSAHDKTAFVKELAEHIKGMEELAERREKSDGEDETVGRLVTACHRHYYETREHTTSRSMLKADMLAHRLERKDADSFTTTALVDDAFDNIGAFILSALDNGKIPFAFQVVKGHPAFTLREHVIFETVQTDILQRLYAAFKQLDRAALDEALIELTDFYALIDANDFTATRRTPELQQLIPALVSRFNVDQNRIEGFYSDIPQRVKDCEQEAQASRHLPVVPVPAEPPKDSESFFLRHKGKFATAGFIVLMTLAFAPFAVVLSVVLIKTLPLFAAILIPAAVLAAVVAIGVAIRHHVKNDSNELQVQMDAAGVSVEKRSSVSQEPRCFSRLFPRADQTQGSTDNLSTRPSIIR